MSMWCLVRVECLHDVFQPYGAGACKQVPFFPIIGLSYSLSMRNLYFRPPHGRCDVMPPPPLSHFRRLGTPVHSSVLPTPVRKHATGAIETFESEKEVYLIMKLCTGGDLHRRAPYTEKAAADIITKVRGEKARPCAILPLWGAKAGKGASFSGDGVRDQGQDRRMGQGKTWRWDSDGLAYFYHFRGDWVRAGVLLPASASACPPPPAFTCGPAGRGAETCLVVAHLWSTLGPCRR